MARFVNAVHDRKTLTVQYKSDNGAIFIKSGGSIAWRFNNPGNIRPKKNGLYQGQVGVGDTASGKFAIFGSYEEGRNEKRALLRRKYNNYTLKEAIYVYAPPNENDTESYIDYLVKHADISRTTKLSTLNDVQLNKLMDAMEKREGFNAKIETRKEFWVNTINVNVSDGSKPIENFKIQVKYQNKVTTSLTDKYGNLPPISYQKSGEQIVLSTISDGKEKILQTVTTTNQSQLIRLVNKSYVATETMRTQNGSTSQRNTSLSPFVYQVKHGDNLSAIAKKFKVTINQLKEWNNIDNANLIYAGQTLKIGNQTVSSSTQQNNPNNQQSSQTIATRSNANTGQPLAIIPINNKEAPWIPIAIRELKQWYGKKEGTITKTDNYHRMSGTAINTLVGSKQAWCASFVNYCLQEAGFKKSRESAAALGFRRDKTNFVKIDKPIFGAIATVVTAKGRSLDTIDKASGHAAFVYCLSKTENRFIMLGGNQDDQISFQDGKISSYRFYVPVAYFEFSKKQNLTTKMSIDEIYQKLGLKAVQTGRSTR